MKALTPKEKRYIYTWLFSRITVQELKLVNLRKEAYEDADTFLSLHHKQLIQDEMYKADKNLEALYKVVDELNACGAKPRTIWQRIGFCR